MRKRTHAYTNTDRLHELHTHKCATLNTKFCLIYIDHNAKIIIAYMNIHFL